MSYVKLYKGAAPATPASGAVLWVDTTGRLKKTDDQGLVSEPGDHELTNYLRNGGFWFAQRQNGGGFGAYLTAGGRLLSADGWGQSNDASGMNYRRVDTMSAPETGLQSQYYAELTKASAIGKMFMSQVIEGKDCVALRGRTVRFQCRLKAIVGPTLTMKMAVLQLSSAGTVDVIPSGSGLFLTANGANGVDPTLGSNLAFLAPKTGVTPDNATASTNSVTCNVTLAWQRFGTVVDIPLTAKNVIVMVWADTTCAVASGFAVGEATLTDGYETQNWAPYDLGAELARCQRYYAKSFNIDTLPAQSVAIGQIRGHVSVAAIAAGVLGVRFPVPMRTAPTCVFFNPAAANAFVRNTTAGTDATATAAASVGDQGMDVTWTGIAAWSVAQAVAVQYTADAEL